jgi:Fe-S oxidoreductase
VDRKAIVQIHCHHHAIMKPDAEKRLLGRLGIEADILTAGCCGMAGSFGFEADKYEVSMRLAEHKLLPKVREADGGTAILADGFSCREQIEQGSGRQTAHLAELIAASLPPDRRNGAGTYRQERRLDPSPALALAVGAGLALAAARALRR